MMHLPELITDLTLILGVAALASIAFRKIRQPVVLGYIVAGFFVSPHMPFVPTVTEGKSVSIWAEIGVIFLLFALGLEFSFKKLARVGGAASITAIVEVVVMVAIGCLTGFAFGWSAIDSVFLGGVLAISSTTIIIRAFDELGVKGRGFANLVFGVLIVEDLVAIVLLVVLSTVAVTQTFAGVEMLKSIFKLAFFLTLWFVSGIFLLPSILKRLKPLVTSEILLIVSIALCFLMVVLTTRAGFSPALGAFIMGSILAETSEGHRIEHLIKPVKDLFAAVFFVSVGMMIDPRVLSQYAVPVLVVTLVTLIGKTTSTTLGALLSGQSIRHSVQSGLSLAQIGEFSFIIAGLGLTLKVTSNFLYPVAVGVSAITTLTTPYLIRAGDPITRYIERRLPQSWSSALTRYASAVQGVSRTTEWTMIMRSILTKVALNGVLILAVFLGTANFISPLLHQQIDRPAAANACGLIIAIVLSAPFLWALTLSRVDRNLAEHLWQIRRYRAPFLLLEAFRWLVGVVLVGFLSTEFIELKSSFILTSALILGVLFVFSRHLSNVYAWFERRFVKNLSAKEDGEHNDSVPPLAPWDAHLARFDIAPESALVGKTLEDLAIREHYGVTIALIERGTRLLPAPGRDERLYPYDKLSIIGTDEQISLFRPLTESVAAAETHTNVISSIGLRPVSINENSPYCGRSIRSSGIREKSHGLVVGIEREGRRILNPDSATTIQPGDLLWIVGDQKAMTLL